MVIVRRGGWGALTAALLLVMFASVSAVGAQEADEGDIPLMIYTVPKLAGVEFLLDGRPFVSDSNGLALTTVHEPGTYELRVRSVFRKTAGAKFGFSMWSDGIESRSRNVRVGSFLSLQAGFDTSYRTEFEDQQGRTVDARIIDSVTVVDEEGGSRSFTPAEQPWLKATRIVPGEAGLAHEDATYLVDRVVVDGANAAPAVPQLLEGSRDELRIELSLHSVKVVVNDALFGRRADASVQVTHPDGRVELHTLRGGEAGVISVPSGSYVASVAGGAISLPSRFEVDGRSSVTVTVWSWLDIAIVVICVGAVVFALLSRRTRFVPSHSVRKPARRASAGEPARPDSAGEASVVLENGPVVETQPAERDPILDDQTTQIDALRTQLEAAKHDKDEIEERLKRVLTNLLNMQDSKNQESDARTQLESERRELLSRIEAERQDVARARSELRRVRDELEGARWSAVFKNDVQIERLELKSQLETYRRNSRELEVQLGRVKGQLQLERAQRKAAQDELEKRRLQLEKLLRERASVSEQLARAEEQLRAIQEIQIDRDDLVTRIELQDVVGEKVAASLAGALEDLMDERPNGTTADQEAS
jgi:hypothetical protein